MTSGLVVGRIACDLPEADLSPASRLLAGLWRPRAPPRSKRTEQLDLVGRLDRANQDRATLQPRSTLLNQGGKRMSSQAVPGPEHRARWGPASGVAFAVILAVSLIVLNNTPDTNKSPAYLLAWYNVKSHQTHIEDQSAAD